MQITMQQIKLQILLNWINSLLLKDFSSLDHVLLQHLNLLVHRIFKQRLSGLQLKHFLRSQGLPDELLSLSIEQIASEEPLKLQLIDWLYSQSVLREINLQNEQWQPSQLNMIHYQQPESIHSFQKENKPLTFPLKNQTPKRRDLPAIPRPAKIIEQTTKPNQLSNRSQVSTPKQLANQHSLKSLEKEVSAPRQRGISQLSNIARPREGRISIDSKKHTETSDNQGSSKSKSPQRFIHRQQSPQASPAPSQSFDLELKQRLFLWLVDLKLVTNNRPFMQELHLICKDGRLFVDLINKLLGRRHPLAVPVISGQSKMAEVIAIYDRIFNYLANFQKFNPRFLTKSKQLALGNQLFFWGLIDDIRYFKDYKISPNDPRFRTASKPMLIQVPKPKAHLPTEYQDIIPNRRSTRSLKSQIISSRVPTIQDHPPEQPPREESLSQEQKRQLMTFFKKIGVFFFYKNNSSKNSIVFRNGYFVAMVLNRMELFRLDGFSKEAETTRAVLSNLSLLDSHLKRRFPCSIHIPSPLDQNKSLWLLMSILNSPLHQIISKPIQKKLNQNRSELQAFLKEHNLPSPQDKLQFKRSMPKLLSVIGFDRGLKPTSEKLVQRNWIECEKWLKEVGLQSLKDWGLVQQIRAVKLGLR